MTPYVSINSYAPKLVPLVYYHVKSRVQMGFFLILVLDIYVKVIILLIISHLYPP